MRKVKVVLVQLGSPKSPKVSDVRTFLKNFLGDPRVVDINPLLWKIILNCFVLPFRPKRSAEAYSRIWTGEGFPLVDITKSFAAKLRTKMPSHIEINEAFLLTEPTVTDVFNDWEEENFDSRATEVLVLPQFPQYSESTIASGIDGLGRDLETRVNIPKFTVVDCYHNSKAFIDNSVRKINEFFQTHTEIERLVISFHGIPKRRVIYKKDVYFQQCWETYALIKERLDCIEQDKIIITFQSRFGSEEWLTPYTDETVEKLADEGIKNIAVYCPSFVVDCLETIDEIGNELAEDVKDKGATVHSIPCVNDDDQWVDDYAHYIKTQVDGNAQERNELNYNKEEIKVDTMEKPEQTMSSPPLSDHAKSVIKIVFLILFLDLVGFSIIFPLFPAMAQYYIEVDSENFFLKHIFNMVTGLTTLTPGAGYTPIVLFGGALGAIYSLLQFATAPFWGSLSDRIGRKPVLIVSLIGLALSYLLWIFAGSFTMLIVARFIGGVMAGNIAAATAVVADVTETKNRSKGMAFVGIAFALGFIIGPAIGGLLSHWFNLAEMLPTLVKYGINPFSSPAVLALALTLFNIVYVIRKFKETLPPEKRGKSKEKRSANPIALLKPLPYKGVNLTNYAYFFFITAFSGMEFTLTFLAVERLNYSPLDNGIMFIFIGFWIAMVQGGYVRRKGSQVGEKKMAMQGLVLLMPGLVCVGLAQATWLLYVGLFFLAVGSGMIIPCLTSLVSLFSPPEVQGKVIGIFRSLGALGRVLGPLLACILYWKIGSANQYYLGAVFLLIPLFILMKVKQDKSV